MVRKSSVVRGVGINDADYSVVVRENLGSVDGRRIRRLIWICSFYQVWADMLARGYSAKYKKKRPTYFGTTVCDEWLTFSNFKAWMETQDWEGKQLDKDLLIRGNKLYSPETCVFITAQVNSFLTESTAIRGEYPIGVVLYKSTSKYKSQCRDLYGKRKHLGYFDTPEEAHQAWLDFKLTRARELASQQTDPRVAEALIARYENYTESP